MESILKRVEVLYSGSPIQKAETMSLLKVVFEEHLNSATGSKEV
jgi:hypothetical protein